MSNRHCNWHFADQIQMPELEILHCSECQVNYWNYPDTRFRHWCFYWNSTPGAAIISNGKTLELTPDKGVLIPPFTPFSTEMRTSFSHFYIHFSGGGILEGVRPEIIIVPGAIAEKCIKEASDFAPFGIAAAVHALLYQVISHIPSESFTDTEGSAVDKRVRHIIDLMYENLNLPISNHQLCRMAGIGINEFYTLFKREMHISPRQYLIMLRMEHASHDLRHTLFTIDEIAERHGFADRYQFSKSFRNYYGLPPAEFRRRHETGNGAQKNK